MKKATSANNTATTGPKKATNIAKNVATVTATTNDKVIASIPGDIPENPRKKGYIPPFQAEKKKLAPTFTVASKILPSEKENEEAKTVSSDDALIAHASETDNEGSINDTRRNHILHIDDTKKI